MNIFLREMRATWKSLLFWSLGMLALIGASMMEFEGLSKTGGAMGQILSLYPKSLKAMFGMVEYDISDPMGYFGVIYVFVQLIGGLHAAMLGANLISKEERDKTAEFLMSKPINRDNILKFKTIAGAACLLLMNLVTWGISAPMLTKYVESVNTKLVGIQISFFAFQLLFMALGIFLAASFRVPKAGQYAVFVFFGCYLLKYLSDLMGGTFLDYITPFNFLGAQHVILDDKTPFWGCLAALVLSAGMYAAAMWRYPKRDMML